MKRAGTLLLLLAGLSACDRQPAAPEPRPTPRAAAATPTALPIDRVAAAVRVAYPKGARETAQPSGAERIFDDHKLLDTAFGPVLLSHGHVPDGAHVYSGTIDVHYLEVQGDGFRLRRSYPKVVELGSSGDFAKWSTSDKFADQPVIYAEGGGMWQGTGCTWAALVALRPDGPAKIADVQTSFDNLGAVESGGQSIEGKIDAIHKQRDFSVRYDGTRSFAERYVWRGGRYLREAAESQLPEC